jgi:hypothetical protein
LAGAAATLWKVPWSGAETRARIAEQAENVLFRLTGMDEWRPDNVPPSVAVDAFAPAAEEAPSPLFVEPAASPLAEETAEEGAALPLTFRGEVLTDKAADGDQAADVVLDGPRPAPSDR